MCCASWCRDCNRCTAIMRFRTWGVRSGRRAAAPTGLPCRRILFPEKPMSPDAFYRRTELDRTNWPELREQILHFGHDDPLGEPRSYPGYARWPLDRVRARLWPPLDRVLRSRRCVRRLGTELPSRRILSRLLFFAHGIHATLSRGPTPSSGGLQCLELYLVNLSPHWLPGGVYH